MNWFPNKPAQKAGGPIHLGIILLVSPAIISGVCCWLSRVNPGGAWWLFGGLGMIAGAIGIYIAIFVALVATILRRIRGWLLLQIWLTIAISALLAWYLYGFLPKT